MMALLLFVIGAVLYYTMRFNLGGVQTQGRHVRAAGMMLMFPAIFTFLLSFIAGLLFASSESAIVSVFRVMAAFELVAMVAGVAVAYILIANPRNAPRLPGILGDIQRDRQSSAPQPPVPYIRSQPERAAPPREQFPAILTVQQAAQYMQVSEAEIVGLIEASKLAAARINYNYRIARSNLDDLLAERETAQNP
ncbi:MAG: helix-turn-helix domain-containing protein [Chloroflexi bacterium]|nr:helix-turn-helix domain-containing protein [Chloroflexota bacterium]